jgi:hypothetical protein
MIGLGAILTAGLPYPQAQTNKSFRQQELRWQGQ